MAEPLRLFVAVRVPAHPTLRRVIAALDGLGKSVRTSHPHQLHVTLKFLGDVAAERVAEIAAGMTAAVGGEPAFAATLIGLGAFPHPDRPSVVWAGLENAEPLVGLAGRMEVALERLGFPKESRPYMPHITLARVKFRPPPELAELLRDNARTAFGSATIDAVELFRSDSGRDGPVYTPLASARLPATSRREETGSVR